MMVKIPQMTMTAGGRDRLEELTAERDALRAALQASVAFSDWVAEELGIEMSETVCTVRVMPKGTEAAARSWASVQANARAALNGGDA